MVQYHFFHSILVYICQDTHLQEICKLDQNTNKNQDRIKIHIYLNIHNLNHQLSKRKDRNYQLKAKKLNIQCKMKIQVQCTSYKLNGTVCINGRIKEEKYHFVDRLQKSRSHHNKNYSKKIQASCMKDIGLVLVLCINSKGKYNIYIQNCLSRIQGHRWLDIFVKRVKIVNFWYKENKN